MNKNSYGFPCLSLLQFLWAMQNMWPIFVLLCYLPLVSASEQQPFPEITFKVFSQFIEQNFNSSITLSTVMMLLLTMTENTTLLSLHARQQNRKYTGEYSTTATGWIRSLARAVQTKLDNRGEQLLDANNESQKGEQAIVALGLKLDLLAKLLKLYPYNAKGQFTGKLKPVSNKNIEPAYVICPDSVVCETFTCDPRSLLQWTSPRDVPSVSLIKNFNVYEEVPVLAGYCKQCDTIYYADHERVPLETTDQHEKVYLNTAQYIKIGQSQWADRHFTSSILSGIYNFHASAASYAAFWNTAFCGGLDIPEGKVTRRQVWHGFVQESIRLAASEMGMNFTCKDGSNINEVTRAAFEGLGINGIIQASNGHSCNECTQKYKKRGAVITQTNPSAVLGMEASDPRPQASGSASNEDDNSAPVKMVVVDGIVMGHTVS